MKLRNVVSWLGMGVLVAMLMLVAPRLHAGGEPPSGAFVKPVPTAVAIDQAEGAGLLAPGTVVEAAPAIDQPAAVEGNQGGPSGLASDAAALDGAAETQAAPELAPEDLKAAGIEAP